MTYIITHDFNQEIPYYVKVVDKSTFDEIYNPEFATQFNTKKKAQEWIDVSSSMKSHSKAVDYEEHLKKYKDWINSGTVRRTLNCINRTMSRPYNNEVIKDVIDWWIYYHNNDDEIDYEDYKTWPKLYSMSKHLFDVKAYRSSDYEELYVTFQIFTKTDGIFEEFENELNMVIDKVTYKDTDGYLILPIFDHYLSERGNSVSLLIHPETKKVKIDGRYSYHKEEFSSLKSAFDFMKLHRYYE